VILLVINKTKSESVNVFVITIRISKYIAGYCRFVHQSFRTQTAIHAVHKNE